MHNSVTPYPEMKLDTSIDVKKYLIYSGMVGEQEDPSVENLSGGVSSSVWKVTFRNNRWVIKQALGKLKVEKDWFADVERIHREHEVMVALAEFLSEGSIPKVLHVDYTNHVYIMTCAEEGAQTWKDILMGGTFDISHAKVAGQLLCQLHSNSHRMRAEDQEKFKDQKYFIQLRVDPFHRYLMYKCPELAAPIQKLVDEVTLEKRCLVHGDFSPKNMLVERSEHIVLIDFEVAHWGNPVFDIAYCLGHLMLKGWYLNKPREILRLADGFLAGYGREVNNLIPHLGLMLLARIDGKSPVNYIQDETIKNLIRKIAATWIQGNTVNSDTLWTIGKALEMK